MTKVSFPPVRIQDRFGNAMGNSPITVRKLTDGTLATLYNVDDRSVVISNPVYTDALGFASFCADDSIDYKLYITYPDSATYNWTWRTSEIVGAQGVQGSQGYQGAQGFQGTQGTQGVQGAQGTQGNQGAQGVQGSQGSQGDTGAQGAQGAQGFQGDFSMTNVLDETTGSVNDWYPTGLETTDYLRVTATADPSIITGLDASWASTGKMMLIECMSAALQVRLVHQSASSAAANRFVLRGSADRDLYQYERVWFIYDSSRWREVTIQGPQGYQGAQGDAGAQGFQGAQGAQGTQGAAGAQGSQGAQGAQGTQGSQGYQGSSVMTGHITGGTRYYNGGHTMQGGGVSLTLNRLFAHPFFVGSSTSFDRIAISSTATVAGAKLRVGLYTDNGGKPDSLIVDAGQMAIDAWGEYTCTISQTLSGMVWIAAVAQTTAPTIITLHSLSTHPLISTASFYSYGGYGNAYYQDSVSGALPSSWGSTYNNAVGNAPMLIMRVT